MRAGGGAGLEEGLQLRPGRGGGGLPGRWVGWEEAEGTPEEAAVLAGLIDGGMARWEAREFSVGRERV